MLEISEELKIRIGIDAKVTMVLGDLRSDLAMFL